MARKRQPGEYVGLALLAAGAILIASVVAGYAVGAVIDQRLETGTRWATIGLLLGFLVGIWDVYLIASRVMALQPPISHRNYTDDSAATPEAQTRTDEDEHGP